MPGTLDNLRIIIPFCILSFISCKCSRPVVDTPPPTLNTNLNHLKFSVEEAPGWSNLFLRKSGWIGADGIFAIPFNGVDTSGAGRRQETLLLFSDTILGEIVKDSIRPGFKMVHNSVAVIKGNEPLEENIQFHHHTKPDGSPESMFIPATPNSKPGDYYWLGDGFVNPSKAGATYIFGYRVRDTSAASFGFAEVGTRLSKYPKEASRPLPTRNKWTHHFF
ncbi:MAG: hypothetical protein WKI04_00295 [Ferruginibacter sp.]